MRIKVREGDLIQTEENFFFDVKGLVHPPNSVVAFIRYIPDPNGDRRKDQIKYRKLYALSKRHTFLTKFLPQYLVYDPVFSEHLSEVPFRAIKKHYQPVYGLAQLRRKTTLDETERAAIEFCRLLKESSRILWSRLGISGSILIGLHTSNSDVDPIVYGSENSRKIHATLEQMLSSQNKEEPIRPYNINELRTLFDFRSKDTLMSFEDFVRTDSRKASHGKFMGRDYFVRFVKDWDEIMEKYGTIHYKPKGYARIKAKVSNDSETIFTPCSYEIEDVKVLEGPRVRPIKEIVSFRGRFCEQARNGEIVIAQGKVEQLQKEGQNLHYRLLLGNNISDHMILA